MIDKIAKLFQRPPATARPTTPVATPAAAAPALEDVPHVVFTVDRDGAWRWLNANWQRVTGLDPADCIGQPCERYVHPKDKDYFQALIAGAFAARREQDHCELRLLMAGGDFRWLEARLDVPPESGAEVVVGTLTDITDRVAEEELLLANHRSLSALINDLPGMVYRCRNDHAWTMEYVSGGCEELTGYTPADIINNKRLSYGSLIHADDQEAVWSEVQANVREQRNFEMYYRLHNAAKEEKWVWERGKGVFSTSGELLGLEGFITDVTQDKTRRDAVIRGNLYDPLTNTPTAYLFDDRLRLCLERCAALPDYGFAVLLMHLGGLTPDASPGFAEQLQSTVVDRLFRVVAAYNTVTSFAHDSFGILLERIDTPEQAHDVGETVLQSMLQPVQIDDNSCYVTASIGVTFHTRGIKSAEDVMNQARNALEQARALGGSRCELFIAAPEQPPDRPPIFDA